MKLVPVLTTVALLEDLPQHKLTRGQIGTVVEHLERNGDRALLVEFSNEEGETYAMVFVGPEQVMELHRKVEAA